LKYHRHLFDKVQDTLVRIFNGDVHADKIIEKLFKDNKKWGKRDRQFVAETIYECVRWRATYEYILEKTDHQTTYIDVHLVFNEQPLPEWSSTSLTSTMIKSFLQKAPPWVRFSLPEWLYLQGLQEIGEENWHSCLDALNEPAAVVLRANTLKATRDEVVRALHVESIECTPLKGTEEAILLNKRANVFRTEAFQKGFFEVQDASSQHVARTLAPEPGERIFDACAGAGGKSLHIAALMKNKGKLLSLDIYEKKLEELRRRAKRGGIDIIETRAISSTKVIKRLQESADGVLLDVPCSGIGVLKRNPDTKWKLSPERLQELRTLQAEILNSYSRMVKPSGKLVYSTCSVLPSENQDQIKRFLSENSQWEKVFEQTLWPHETGFDGFYICKLIKK
jgi:16S rRNA (cytosine967-C5)-methyltransferase